MIDDTLSSDHSIAALSFGTLIVVNPDGNKATLRINRPTWRIGHAADNDLVLEADATAAYQVLLLCSQHQVEVLDLGTGTPALLDGTPLRANHPVVLAADSVLQIGATRIFFYPEAAATQLLVAQQMLLGTLLVVDAERRTQVLPLTSYVVRIGRALDNDVLLDDHAAPPYKAQIVVDAGSYQLIDLEQGTSITLLDWHQVGTLRLKVFAPDQQATAETLWTLPPLQAVAVPDVSIEAETQPAAGDAHLEQLVDQHNSIDFAAQLAADAVRVEQATDVVVDVVAVPALGTLVVVFPDQNRYATLLLKPTLRLGRDPANDLVLDHASVALFQAQIFCHPPHYQVFDLGHGTEVDEVQLTAYSPFALSADSVIRMGQLQAFVYPPEVTIDHVLPLPTGSRTPQPPVEVVSAAEYAQAQQQRAAVKHVQTAIDVFPRSMRVAPGEQTTLQVKLINHAPVLDHLSLDIDGLPNHWYSFSTPALPLFPGTRGTIELLLHPPAEPETQAGTYSFQVMVRSQHHPAQTPQADLQLAVDPYTQLKLDLFPPLQSGARAATYTVEIINRSNQRHRLTVYCYDPQQAFWMPFENRVVWIEAGAVYQFPITMRLRRRLWWLGRQHDYPFILAVQASDHHREQAEAVFQHVPPLRRTKHVAAAAPESQLPDAAQARPLRLAPPARLTPRVALPVVAAHEPRAVAEPEPRETEAWVAATLQVTPNLLRTEAGGAAMATISVTQRADVVDRLRLEVTGVPAQWVTLVPDTFSLLPQTRGEAQLIISPPRNAHSSATKHTLRIIAHSEKQPQRSVVAPLVLDIQPFTDFRAALYPTERTFARKGTFQLEVQNRSNQQQEFAFRCADPEAAVRFGFQPVGLIISAGATQRTTLQARFAKRRWLGQQQLYPFTVEVQPVAHDDLVQVLPGRVQDRPLIPAWLVQLVLPFFMIIVAVALATGRLNIRTASQKLFGGAAPQSQGSSAGSNNTDPAAVTPAILDTAAPGTITDNADSPPPGDPVMLGGSNRWTLGDSPVQLDTTYVISPEASLTIESGVEVLFAPGASLQVLGALSVEGIAGAPVRFTRLAAAPWGDLALLNGSQASISGLELHHAGATGQAFFVQSADVTINDLLITTSQGGIVGYNSAFNGRNISLVHNTLGAHPAIAIELLRDNQLTLDGVLIRQNEIAADGALIHLAVPQIGTTINLRNSLLLNDGFVGVLIQAEEPYVAQISCNTIAQTSHAIALNNLDQAQAAQVRLENNALGSSGTVGLYSTVQADANNNWWGTQTGPVAQTNTSGTGSQVIGTADVDAWLQQPPSCVPTP